MFNFNLFFFLISLLFLITISITDVKFHKIPNKIILYFLIVGFVFKIIQSIYFLNFNYILFALLCFIIVFVISYLLWEFGVIAGGDLKSLLVIAILNPININFLNNFNLFNAVSWPIFPITLLITSFLVLVPYILLIAIIQLFTKGYYKNLIQIFTKKSNIVSLVNTIFLIYLISMISNLFQSYIPLLLILIISYLLLFIFLKIKNINLLYFYSGLILSYITILIIDKIYKLQLFNLRSLFSIMSLIVTLNFLIILYRIIKSKIFTTPKTISELKEGDCLVYNYYYQNRKLIMIKPTFLNTIKLFMKNEYFKDLKIDSNKAKGISNEDIMFLNTMYKNNVLQYNILVKRSVAFAPSLLLSYLLLNILNDFIWFLI